jgi:hypothetical protein
MNACSSTRMHGASRNVCSRPEVVGKRTMCVVRCSRAKLVISHARAEPNWSAARKRPMWNHPRQSPTIHPSLSYFPVFSSPTATLEVVGNTGNRSSEKAGVGGPTPSLAPNFRLCWAEFHVLRKPTYVIGSNGLLPFHLLGSGLSRSQAGVSSFAHTHSKLWVYLKREIQPRKDSSTYGLAARKR